MAQSQPVCHEADPRAHPRDHNIDISHMLLQVSFDPANGLVRGNVTHTFRTLQKQVDSIVLDAVDIRLQEVKLDGKDVKYKNTGTALVIYPTTLAWQSEHKISLRYQANPKHGIYFIGWNDSTHRSRKQIWTQGEGIDNRNWIPSFDDPADKLITELEITLPEGIKVLSNGQKITDKKQKDGTHFWHYRISHPHALYLTMIGAGDYAVKTTHSKSGVPIYEWYYPDQPDRLEPTYRYTERIMDFFEKEIGVPYPWESYSQIPVQDFIYGAMENTTATVFGDFFLVDGRAFLDRNYIGVNAHEMAHQWFGDLVTTRSPNHMWLQESFATFYSKLADRDIFGEESYEWNRRGEANAALNASKTDQLPVAHSSPGTARHYQKGSFVLDMLRDIVGPDEFRKVIQYYLKTHAYGNVTTYDLEVAFHEVLGRNMDWFFDEWIYRGGEPDYKVSYQRLSGNEGAFTRIAMEQVQQQTDLVGLFKMPITVEVHYQDGTMDTKTEWVSERNHFIEIPNKTLKPIAYVLFDPGSQILKNVTFIKSLDELKAQAENAPYMIDRYDAIVAMRDLPMADKKKTLLEVNNYRMEEFHAIQSEILSQLGAETDADSRALFTTSLKDRSPQVRLAAINNIKSIPSDDLPACEKLLTDSSYNVVQAALTKLCRQFPQNTPRYLHLTDGVQGMGRAVRIAWLQQAVNDINSGFMDELADYTTNAYEFRTRINAFNALQAVDLLNAKAAGGLFDAALSSNGRLAGPAKDCIAYFVKQMAYRSSLQQLLAKSNYPEAQRKTLSKLLE